MNRNEIRLTMRMSPSIQMLFYLGLATFAALPAYAQVPVDDDGNPIAALQEEATLEDFDDEDLPMLSAAELEDIVGPVALYPDDLLAIVLPASTYPLQVVQAARFLERLKSDASLKPDEEWDESITALLNYPEIVDLMNEDIDWTWRLGEAVVAQQADVIAAIESFRDKAYAAGNLKSDERQTVSNEDGVIEIEPASEDVIYVPYYEPEQVVVYQPRPVYYYYPHAYPVYYYPYPYGYSFASGYFWGVTTAFSIGWLTDHLHVYHHSYWGHPYYGHYYPSYYYYRQPSLTYYNHYYVDNSHHYWNYRYRDGDYWRPRRYGGARPGYDQQRVHYYRDRSRDDWRHRGQDGADNDRNRSNSTGARQARNRNDGNGNVRRDRSGNGDRQASNRDRGNPANRQGRTPSASPDRNDISFRSRDARARADQERHRTRASEDLNRSSERSAGFAPPSRTTTTASNERRPTPRSSSGISNDRNSAAALSNPRRQVQQSPPRQANGPSFQRPSARSEPLRGTAPRSAAPRSAPVSSGPPRSMPQRSAPPPQSAPSRSEAPPSAPPQNSGTSRRSESRSSDSSSRGSSNRGETSSRRRH
jgi:hypothetical protein